MRELWILVQYTTYFSWSRIKRQMIVWKLKNVSRRTATKKELTKWHAFTTHNCIFLKKRQCSCNAKGILLLMMRGKEVHSNLNWISHGYPSTSSSASCMKNQGQILYMNSSDHAVSPTADLLFFWQFSTFLIEGFFVQSKFWMFYQSQVWSPVLAAC